jgi:hypothetical protein
MASRSLLGRAPADGSRDGEAPRTHGDRYKWIALSNTTLGVLMAVLNSSIILIALPDIFRVSGRFGGESSASSPGS